MVDLERCRDCGAPLLPGAIRCSDCGAPVRILDHGVRRTSVAGLFLLIIVALSLFESLYVVADPEASIRSIPGLDRSSFQVTGHVHSANGTIVATNLSLDGKARTERPAEADGRFELGNASGGFHELVADGPDGRQARVRVFLVRDLDVDVGLPSEAQTAIASDHPTYRHVRFFTAAFGYLLVGIGGLTLAGAVACYRRRGWRWALAGAIASIVAAPPLSLILGPMTFLVVVKGRSEFPRQTVPARPH